MANNMGGVWRGAAAPSATPVIVDMNGAPLPCTITLKSSVAGRLIELSTDGGTEYFAISPDASSATMLVLSILSPVSHVRITGTTADTWSIR